MVNVFMCILLFLAVAADVDPDAAQRAPFIGISHMIFGHVLLSSNTLQERAE
jgi:hypothetical protein